MAVGGSRHTAAEWPVPSLRPLLPCRLQVDVQLFARLTSPVTGILGECLALVCWAGGPPCTSVGRASDHIAPTAAICQVPDVATSPVVLLLVLLVPAGETYPTKLPEEVANELVAGVEGGPYHLRRLRSPSAILSACVGSL